MLRIRLQDIQRATLPINSGNEGWIGVSPKGDRYHVVVPVDVQIARGVMACNLPTDGTPFGGYAGWLYFRCPPWEEEGLDAKTIRLEKAGETGDRLIQWLAAYGIQACLETEHSGIAGVLPDLDRNAKCPGHTVSRSVAGKIGSYPRMQAGALETAGNRGSPWSRESWARKPDVLSRGPVSCSGCGKQWSGLPVFLRDAEITLKGYRACLEDFSRGRYLFAHVCGHIVEVSVSRFARSIYKGTSLIGSHACPGLCCYEMSLLTCTARCEGAGYRRIARKLKSRRSETQI
jgi:hypothetical protein